MSEAKYREFRKPICHLCGLDLSFGIFGTTEEETRVITKVLDEQARARLARHIAWNCKGEKLQ